MSIVNWEGVQMNGTWGNFLGVSLFGESHGAGIGVVVNNLPPGISLDLKAIEKEMERRRPGTSNLVSKRNEKDKFEIFSGFFQGKTTGAPLTVLIRNTNHKSKDYDLLKDILRPGHADWTVYEKYKGFHDYRGSGHFSGRLTAGIVFAGAVAKQILFPLGISIGAEVVSIGSVGKHNRGEIQCKNGDKEQCNIPKTMHSFSIFDESFRKDMEREIENARLQGDSVGGVVSVSAVGIPSGLGGPLFENMEGRISQMIFSIPAVKAIEFGAGFSFSQMTGSVANDSIFIEDGQIKSKTNHNGGILGGITSGMPLEFTVAIKPTPSISTEQETINYKEMKKTGLRIEGRHDPCIVPRVVPVLENALALVLLDTILEQQGSKIYGK